MGSNYYLFNKFKGLFLKIRKGFYLRKMHKEIKDSNILDKPKAPKKEAIGEKRF